MSKKEQKTTILVGEGKELFQFHSKLKRPERILGIFCSNNIELPDSLERLGDIEDVPSFLDENIQVQRVYCCTSNIEIEQAERIQHSCKARAVRFCAVLPVINDLDAKMVVMKVGSSLLFTPKSEPLSRFHNRLSKRLFDFILTLIFLLTLFPLVYFYKAIQIKRKRRGPSFITERCCGPNGRTFSRVSFRTSERTDSAEAAYVSEKNSIAQVFNVLTGSMSLVGPECYILNEEDEPTNLPKHLERRVVKSGLTGWAQVNKKEGNDRLEADIWYVENWSIWLDIRIIIKSLF